MKESLLFCNINNDFGMFNICITTVTENKIVCQAYIMTLKNESVGVSSSSKMFP